ncbi:Beta-barrel assembly-enhancing protease [bacterium HR33]|nr:Beta-barrel assembly-enhancing protease [bacterium HR33]
MEQTDSSRGRLGTWVAVAAWLLVPVLPADALAQRQAAQTPRFLILAPIPEDPGDSAFAVELGDELRSRVEGKTRRRLTVISKDRIGEALEASGFSRDAILDRSASEQLARFLQADAYTVATLVRNPAPRVSLRLIDLRRSGLSGWIHYEGQAGTTARQVAEAIADEMERHVRAAERTQECYERRDRQDFRGAKDRARRAFEEVPNYPAAALCIAVVYEVERAPPDSQIAVLEMAVRGDSLNARAWDMLGRAYQQLASSRTDPGQAHEDSLRAAEAFAKQLLSDPNDTRLRTGIAALFITLRQYERARQLLDEGLERSPEDLTMLQLKARACEEGELWSCLVEALAAQYEIDTSLVGNVEFYAKIFGAAQSANDTSAMLRWSEEAVRRAPQSVALWRARSSALNAAGMTDSAFVAYQKIAELDPSDIRPLLGMAQILTERVKIDSTVALDTVTLGQVDSLLQRVVAMTSNGSQPTDTTVWMNVAVMYFRPATQMIQARVRPDFAIRWLEKAKTYDLRKQLTTQADFFLGLGYMFNLSSAFDFNRLSESRSCQRLRELDDYLRRLRSAMTAGASVQPSTAQQVLSNIEGIEKFVVEAGRAWNCS